MKVVYQTLWEVDKGWLRGKSITLCEYIWKQREKKLKIKESNFQVQKLEEYKWKEMIIKGKDRSKREGKKQHLTWSIKQNIGSVKRPIRRTNVGKLQPAPVQQSMPGEKHSNLPTALTGKFVVTQPLAPPRIPVFFSLFPLCLSVFPGQLFLSPLSSNLQHFLPHPHSQLPKN